MTEESIPNQTISLPEIDAEKNTSVKKIVEFLNDHLQAFPSFLRNLSGTHQITAEDLISQELCNYLQSLTYDNHGIFMFQFQRKAMDSSRSSDLGVILRVGNYLEGSNREIFLIEAKRLPTPGKDRKGKTREREYVNGSAGGMERYKRGHHGGSLKESALIGYIQDHDSDYWFETINQWIDDLITNNSDEGIVWNKNDLLVFEKKLTTIQKFSSINTRITKTANDTIRIHHYLMALVKQPERCTT